MEFKEFAINMIESAVLCDDKECYTSKEIVGLIECAKEDYQNQFGSLPTNLSIMEVGEFLQSMNIELAFKLRD